jgi:hypothetical protein
LYHTFNGTQIFGQASTEAFAGSSGLRIKLYAGAGSVTPSGFLEQLGYNGFTTVAGTQATYPLIRAREQTLNLVGSFDIIDSQISTLSSGGVRSPASKDSLRVFRLGADYALRDIWAGDTRPAINSSLIRVSQGVSRPLGVRSCAGLAPSARSRGRRPGERRPRPPPGPPRVRRVQPGSRARLRRPPTVTTDVGCSRRRWPRALT